MRDRDFDYARIHDTRGRRVADSTPLRVAAMVLTLLACTASLKALATTLTQAISVSIKQETHWEEAKDDARVRGLEGLEGEEEGLRRIGGYVGDALIVGLDPMTEAADWSVERMEIPTSWTETPPELDKLAAKAEVIKSVVDEDEASESPLRPAVEGEEVTTANTTETAFEEGEEGIDQVRYMAESAHYRGSSSAEEWRTVDELDIVQ